jgi:hypothetical protein
MWKESKLTTLTLNGVIGKDKIIRDGHKEHEFCDMIVEINKTRSTFSACIEGSKDTFDLISMKERNSIKKMSTKKTNDRYFKDYAINKAELSKFKIPEDISWIKKEDDIVELFSNNKMAARIYISKDSLDCYVFYRGKRFDDYIRFAGNDINNAKFLCIDKANLMGWRINYE